MTADAFSDILESVRMEGSIFSRADLTAPWGVESGTLVDGVFHAVVAGTAWVSLADESDAVEVGRGDVVVFPFGDNHRISDSPDRPTRKIGLLTSVDERGMGKLVVDGGGAPTSLICGRITFEQGTVHPVLSGLPRLIHVRDVDGRMADIADTLIGLIATEIDQPSAGSNTIVSRLTDALVVYVLRGYVEGHPDVDGSWLSGLRDPNIAEVLAAIHGKPAHPWTAEALAGVAGLSRSAFFSRFKGHVGEPPAEYLTRWRIHLATRLLREENCSVAVTARRVGYGTEAAFSNAFMRVVGVRPGAYRRSA